MKPAISNIAWPLAAEEEALDILRGARVRGVEVAPTRIWPEWVGASVEAAGELRLRYESAALPAVAQQAILFGKPAYKLFGTVAERRDLMHHLEFCADMASAMGTRRLVFGAPKNRLPEGLDATRAFDLARDFFKPVAAYYESRGVCLCLEANPTQYACEFITNSADAGRLVRAVNSPGFGLHLDTACMQLAGENLSEAIRANFDLLRHFHVSEPFLGSFELPSIDHERVADTLQKLGYDGWISLEMREAPDAIPALRQAAGYLAKVYNGD